ncbi:hypothetical protein POTOM_020894 [Populus tomentosa]|uniref:Uncharacterized protein n=1 Tax=Populus tomentosa TaxID=118781 RepID=A0A8X8D0H3_POPTO|nr:hypothetical protein POTOM_020894 [Populus tomentosa]
MAGFIQTPFKISWSLECTSLVPFCVSQLFFFHFVFFVLGKTETSQPLVGNGNSANMGRADHESSSGKDRGECKKLGDGGSEETLSENEDSIYT